MATALDEFTGLARDARAFIPDLKKTNEKFQNLLGADVPNLPVELIAAQQQPPAADQANLKVLIRDIQDLVRTMRPTVEDLRASIRRLEPEVASTVKSARQTFDGVNEILSPENRKQFAELLKNINGVAVYVIRISSSLATLLDTAEKTLKNIGIAQVTEAGGAVYRRPNADQAAGRQVGVDCVVRARIDRSVEQDFDGGPNALSDPGERQRLDSEAVE